MGMSEIDKALKWAEGAWNSDSKCHLSVLAREIRRCWLLLAEKDKAAECRRLGSRTGA
jgi:hypothetical protein